MRVIIRWDWDTMSWWCVLRDKATGYEWDCWETSCVDVDATHEELIAESRDFHPDTPRQILPVV